MKIASYITPVNLRQTELNSSNEQEDNILAELCLEASRDFEAMCGDRVFYPYLETKYFDHPDHDERKGQNHSTLKVKDDILQVTAMTTRNTQSTLATTDFFLRTGSRGRYSESPYDRIQLEYGSTGYTTNFQWDGTPQKANAVTAFWGYVKGWGTSVAASQCWVSAVSAIQSTTASTYVVDELAGVNALGLYPRVSKYDLVMWYNTVYADMEMAFVTDVDEDSQTISVNRGINGTATDTISGTPTLYVYKPPGDIVRAVRRLAAYYYRARQTSRGDIDRPIMNAIGNIVMPSALPQDILDVVNRYQGIFD